MYVTASDEWEEDSLWVGEYEKSQARLTGRWQEQGKHMQEVAGSVVGIANLLEDDGMRLLRTIEDNPAELLEAFGTETIQALLQYHWQKLQCSFWSKFCLGFHLLSVFAFAVWSKSVRRESYPWRQYQDATRVFSASDNRHLTNMAGCIVAFHLVWLMSQEIRLFIADWKFQKREHQVDGLKEDQEREDRKHSASQDRQKKRALREIMVKLHSLSLEDSTWLDKLRKQLKAEGDGTDEQSEVSPEQFGGFLQQLGTKEVDLGHKKLLPIGYITA
jgi:hypothetical protein